MGGEAKAKFKRNWHGGKQNALQGRGQVKGNDMSKTLKEKRSQKLQVQYPVRHGWSVQITRDDGTTFLARGSHGDLPPIWIKSNRKWALQFKQKVLDHGFKAKIVPVVYINPVLI